MEINRIKSKKLIGNNICLSLNEFGLYICFYSDWDDYKFFGSENYAFKPLGFRHLTQKEFNKAHELILSNPKYEHFAFLKWK